MQFRILLGTQIAGLAAAKTARSFYVQPKVGDGVPYCCAFKIAGSAAAKMAKV